MYAAGDLLPPFLQDMGFFFSPPDHQHLLQLEEEELLQRFSQNRLLEDSNCHSHLPIIIGSCSNLAQAATILEYDLGGEGDLFKAPEPIMEESVIALDPVTTVISMMSSGEDITATEAIKVADIESIESAQLLSEVFCECKKDLILLDKTTMEEPPSDLSDITIAPLMAVEDQGNQDDSMVECLLHKSLSSTLPTVKDQTTNVQLDGRIDCSLRPNFLDFQEMDFGAAFGMRRAYSEGDIKILGNDSSSLITSGGGGGSSGSGIPFPSVRRMLSMDRYKIEERQEKLSRYRKKKTTRNFGRKIKYACRKALADCQPRIRGRFAKTEELELPKPSM